VLKLAEVKTREVKHTILVCDNCKREIDCVNSLEVQRQLKKNGWVTRTKEFAFEMNTRFIPKHYCSECAVALKIKIIS
jgi:hypothetical protein